MPSASATEATARLGAETIVLEPRTGLASLNVRELWRYRELLGFITWRDIKVRYKQTALGAAWAVLQPLLLMVVFTLFLGRFIPDPTDDVPYAVFAYAGLVPWTLFASSLNGGSTSLVMNANLVSKVYFPRLILPVAAAGSFVIDFVIGLIVLVVLMVLYGITPGPELLLLPVFALLALMTAMSVAIWLSALNVRYRDFVYAIPFIVQLWLFASPVAYASSIVEGSLAKVIYGLNPMAGVLEGFRWALLGLEPPDVGLFAASVGAMLLILGSGLFYFRSTERTFADVI